MDVQLRADEKTNCRRETGVGLQNLRGLLLDHERAEKKIKGVIHGNNNNKNKNKKEKKTT